MANFNTLIKRKQYIWLGNHCRRQRTAKGR
ncbi:conjugal transfer pilus assembly protein TraB [Klebsiella pneumoniae]|nr:conjugal transfer pilus assembly protein TraB [Klebsiella pneumoniae]